ncbi:phosphoribosyl transferase domain protein [Paraburkholderia xenovorans LB400]|nr:phosphoribosyl transferase domain protein [Paraburkholderia xenovorans LB400]
MAKISSQDKRRVGRSGGAMSAERMAAGPPFRDRAEAGRMLALQLGEYAGRRNVIVLALPRGGVPVGYEVARALGVELDVLVVRKLGVPHYPELAMGAIATGGALYLDEQTIRMARVTQPEVAAVLNDEHRELARREALYRGPRPPPNLEGRTVVIVDDGIATGSSVRVAVEALRTGKPARIVVAVPVTPESTAKRLEGLADQFVCTHPARHFGGVGQFYRDFGQTSDAEVRALLARSHQDTL